MAKETPKQRQERLKLYQSYRESGEGYRAFAREHGTKEWRVRWAVKKTEREMNGRDFQEVSVGLGLCEGSEFEIRLSNGRELRLKGAFSEKRLATLIRVLEQC